MDKRLPLLKLSVADVQNLGTRKNIVSVTASTKTIEIIDLMCENSISTLPVVDEQGRLEFCKLR